LVSEGDEVEVGVPIAELQLKNENYSNNKPELKLENVSLDSGELDTSIDVNKTPVDDQILADKRILVTKDSQDQNVNRQNTQQPKISPAARSRAERLGIDWRLLSKGSGPDGAIVLDDINIPDEKSAEQVSDTVKDPSNMMRQAISATVSRSKREIPHYYLQLDIVLNNTINWLSDHNANLPPSKRILSNAVIYSAIARALTSFPAFNGFYRDGHFQPSESVHLGNAINLRQGGLMVAAIHDAQRLGLIELMEKITDQVSRARKGGLRMSEMQDATVTLSNMGDRGTDSIQSIIFPPQVAIFGIGRQREVPWVIDNTVNIATIVSVSLAADHRVSDGHSGARLLNKINKLLQTPEVLM